MESFYGWIRGIVCYLLFVSLLTLLLPEKKYRKYMKLASGLIFLLVVADPMLKLTELDLSMEQYYQNFEDLLENKTGVITDEALESQAEKAAYAAYEDWLRSEIRSVSEEEGYEVVRTELLFSDEENNTGELERIYLKIRSPENIRLVEPVIIAKENAGKRAENASVTKIREKLKDISELKDDQIWIEEGI